MTIKPRFETTPDVEKCVNYLRSRGQASYTELSRHLNRDVQGRDRYILDSARRKLEREGIVFVIKTGIGMERATNGQVATLSTTAGIHKIKRTVRRSSKRQKIVDVQGLTAEERAAFYIGRAVLGAIGQAARDAFKSKIAKAVADKDEMLGMKETLSLFRQLRRDGNPEH